MRERERSIAPNTRVMIFLVQLGLLKDEETLKDVTISFGCGNMHDAN
jgi:hypothetical protein